MAIKFFLIYLGSLFMFSIVLLTIVKKFAQSFGGSGKRAVIYGALSSILASGAAYAATFVSDQLFTVFWFLAGIFLLFGIVHMLMVHKKYFSPTPENARKIFVGELIFALSVILFTVLIFSSLQYFLKDKSFLFYPMTMSTLAFFVPLLFVHTFQAAYSIPSPVFSTWVYPLDNPIPLPDDNPREKLLVIGFEITKKATDSKRTFFRAKAPENILLGELYYHFINDYNELQSETPIEFGNNKNEAYEWAFRLKTKWFQTTSILDPSLSVKDNGIKENSVIVCERIINDSNL